MKKTTKIAIWCALVLITAPLWIIPGTIWMVATGRTPRSCGEEGQL